MDSGTPSIPLAPQADLRFRKPQTETKRRRYPHAKKLDVFTQSDAYVVQIDPEILAQSRNENSGKGK